eukprot:15436678-Alexandrium_andersonii.AAC.1
MVAWAVGDAIDCATCVASMESGATVAVYLACPVASFHAACAALPLTRLSCLTRNRCPACHAALT